MCSREKERRQRKEHEEKMKGRVFIRSDSFACDYHCSVRLMKTHERSRRSHLTSPSGRSSRTSSSHHPISGPSLLVFLPLCRSQSLFVDLGCKSQGVADRVLVSCLLVRVVCIFHTWKHCGGALMRKLIKHNQPLKSGYMDAFTESREKAMVVNLDFIKAIVTTEEVLLLDPLC
ncbi:hypothetical protein TEA_020515 [Camellia sinensis var. sinensis]|uniref:Uncharacterized protein n=1 Tax=Camellia sinensis var. sinensis TaxID=542762 RepID=A0A4S4EVN3_CAMSN|nr:hypothetical protein TEA_020515 [Camellia sinensis var. sinensis]